MNITLKYGAEPFVMPTLGAEDIAALDGTALKILVLLAKEKTMSAADIRAALSIDERALSAALASLTAIGVLTAEEIAAPTAVKTAATEKKKEKDAPVPKRSRTVEMSVYTDDEFTAVLDKRADLQNLITEAQNAIGKTLYQSESKLLVSIAEGFEFDVEYMLILLAYCRRIDRKNMRYVEKVATTLYDLGIKNSVELTEYLRTQEEMYHFEKTIRGIFGLGSRAFTTKEKAFLAAWQGTYKFDKEMLQRAYDITVSATAKPSLHYANSILERWYSEGIKTVAELDAATESKTAAKSKSAGGATSYDVDDFFRAALDRSYGDAAGASDKKE